MASTVDQKTYLLNKYLKGPSGDKKKKKKKKHVKGTGLRIIDDDVDTSRLRPLDGSEIEALGLGDEDAPQVAGIVDERPEEVRKMEQFGPGSKWRVIAQNDGMDSKIRVEEIKRNITKMDDESHPIFGKMYSDSEDEKKNDSDLSPPRKNTSNSNKSSGNKEKSKNKQIHRGSDGDLSPPESKNRRKSSDSDQSPPRRAKQVDKVKKDDKKREDNLYKRDSPKRKKRIHSSDSDLSPPRKKEHDKSRDKPRKPSRWGIFGPEEPITKKNRKSEDSDLSPPRKSRSKRSVSPQRQKDTKSKREPSEDSDLSPPRKSKRPSPPSWKRDNSDIPQKSRKPTNRDHSVELSPPRRSRNEQSRYNRSPENASSTRGADERLNSRNRLKDVAKGGERYNDRRRKSDSPPPSNKKMAKTLEGKMAGLQDARQMRDENADFRRREDELYNNMSADLSGRNATVVNRRLGKRETSADREKKRADQEKQKEMEAKYDKWGKGLKQVSDQTARVEDYLHEASKPLARHRDDVDLERSLKAQERAGDPMLEYMRGKKTERSDAPERPIYKGDWPPNRFNVRPGYRWDGVDRSNGYEKKYFDHKSKAKALAEEAYKWSTEDL